MALDDRFFPEDASLITKFDNFMIKQAGKVGQVYQERTGKSYEDLTKIFYKYGVGSSLASTLTGNILGPPIAYIINHASRNKVFETSIEEEIRLESKGFSRKYDKFCRFMFLLGSLGIFSKGILEMAGSEGEFSNQLLSLRDLMIGVSLLNYSLAEYLSKSNLPKPPKKEAKEKVKRKFGIMFPEPIKA